MDWDKQNEIINQVIKSMDKQNEVKINLKINISDDLKSIIKIDVDNTNNEVTLNITRKEN